MRPDYMKTLFTPAVQDLQKDAGSYGSYARATARADGAGELGPDEAGFLAAADHFYLASVGETGWPYVQHRGGPAGFLRVLGPRQIGYADFRGNQQFISAGNVSADPRVSLLVMDYANQARLKLLGRLRFVPIEEADEALRKQLIPAGYPARVDRLALIDIEGYDWNCPQHIVPRYTREQMAALVAQ